MADGQRPRSWFWVFVGLQCLVPLVGYSLMYFIGRRDVAPAWMLGLAVLGEAGSHALVWWALYAIAKRFPATGNHLLRDLGITAAAIVALSAARLVAVTLYLDVISGRETPINVDLVLFYYPGQLIAFACMAAATYALVHYEWLNSSEYRAAKLREQLDVARLRSVQARLRPHFLFNALNAVSSLIYSDPPRSRRVLAKLEHLLADVLEPSSDIVPLKTEVDIIRRYLDLQMDRFGSRVSISIDVANELEEVPVPYLILLPIVENAVQHGLSARAGARRLSISAAQIDGAVRVEVTDDGPGPGDEWREGVGLASIRERMAGYYGARDALDITSAPKGGTVVTLTIPLREQYAGIE